MPMDILYLLRQIEAIAHSGLAYVKDVYDKERYEELLALAAEEYSELSGVDLASIKANLSQYKGYATPKLCVRGVILKEDRVLMVKERQVDKWSLPGGWADVNLSPKESMIKEIKEETGFDCEVIRLVALWDKLKHDHPPSWPHVVSAFFHAEITAGEIALSHEISEVDYFTLNNLPDVCPHRINPKQIHNAVTIIREKRSTAFD